MKPFDWLDARLGHRQLFRRALDEPVPGGSRWAYVFGSALVVLLALQALTGIALASYYSPSTTDAWGSVYFIQHHVAWGWFLRGMHHYGASAMVVLLFAHLLQTVWFGAFKSPRELNWLAGFFLLQLVLGMALTGYLLPWDQKGYWATQVATSIAGTVPLVGDGLQALLVGGQSYGNLTLTRFYALHVLVLPLLLGGLLLLHLYLFRRHGLTPPPRLPLEEQKRRAQPFFPNQLLKDVLFSAAVVGIIAYLTYRSRGAPLEAPADPASGYLARPEWYFLPLFQLLKYFEGRAEVMGTVVIPSLAMGFIALLPFLYALLRRKTRRAHALMAGAVTAGLLGTVLLGALALYEDAESAAFADMSKKARDEAALAQRLAQQGVPVEGPLFLYRNDAQVWGERVFMKHCRACHTACEQQPYKGDVCLEGYATRPWLRAFLRKPQSPHFFGNTQIDEMDAYEGSEEQLNALVEFLYGQGEREGVDVALASEGQKLFVSEGCEACHALDGRGTGDAPDLKGYASTGWLTAFIRAPDASRFYGKLNKMKRFETKDLSDDELAAVVAYLRAQPSTPLKFLQPPRVQ
jgi:ubiquinol-cytochrome c reductase cytochrome b subunit